MSTLILKALSQLDATNNNHWTGEGLPRIDTVKFLAGGAEVTRDEITKAAPNFSRTNLALGAVQGEPAPSGNPTGTAALEMAPAPGTQAAGAFEPSEGNPNGEVHSQAEEGAGIFSAADYDAASLEEKLAFAQGVLADREQEVILATRSRDAASAEVDRLIYASHKEGTPDDNATAIRDYLAVQAANLEAKAVQVNKMREANIDFKALMPGPSPLDAALAGRSRKQYRSN